MKQSWITIAIAIFIVIGLAAIALVGGSAYWVSRHVNTEFTSTESAEAEFTRERARFAGQQPMVEISGGEDTPTIRKISTPEAAERVELQTVHARVFVADESKIVRVDIPFWLVRLGMGMSFMPQGEYIKVEDLERHGPGLIVNGKGDDGHQILVWVD